VSGNCYDWKHKDYYEECGAIVIGDLVWSDEFDDVNGDGTINASKWMHNNGAVYNNELQAYTGRRDNSFVNDGVLKIIAKCEEYSGLYNASYTSARLITQGLADWGPGHRVEVRAKLPNGKGAWPAIWMLPTHDVYGGWPDSGEIDIMESVGCDHGRVYGTVHTEAYNHVKKTQLGQNSYLDETQWHTYAIDWLDSQIRFYTDGNHYFTFAPDDTSNSAKWPFNQRFFLILNVAVGGAWGGYCLNGGPSCTDYSHFAHDQVMEVDFVHVYALKGRR
jgi:beta-glucanase (GH16 family)